MKQKARLVLGGGAAFGFAHIGVLDVLQSEFEITGIVGTSMGAIIGGLYAQGKTPQEILELARESGSSLIFNPKQILNRPLKLSLDLIKGMHNKKKVMELLGGLIGPAQVEELPLPFVAVAYDLVSSQTVLIDKGSLAGAMRASSSLPLLFAPHDMGGHLFVDGGVEHPLPLAFADAVPGNLTIAVNVLTPVSPQARRFSNLDTEVEEMRAPEVAIQSLMQNQGFLAIQASLQYPPDLLIDAYLPGKNMFDLLDVEEFFEHGQKAARASLEAFGQHRLNRKGAAKYLNFFSHFKKSRRPDQKKD